MKTAERPFQFCTVSYLTRIGNLHATNLRELHAGLESCAEESIFYHTFQSLERHHFLTEGFSNDFAEWVLSAAGLGRLAERIAAVDIRGYLTLKDLRRDLLGIVDQFCNSNPGEAQRTALEPFYFCESVAITIPLPWEAHTLGEFRLCVERLSHASFQFHFLVSRLRLQLRTNDFSLWCAEQLGLEPLAHRINQIDVYTNTIDSARSLVLAFIDGELGR
jgi:hypothetical protein